MRYLIPFLLVLAVCPAGTAQTEERIDRIEESLTQLEQQVSELEDLSVRLEYASADVQAAQETGNRVIFFSTMIVAAMSLLTLVIVGMFAIRLLHENAEFQQMRDDVRLIRELQDGFAARLEEARAEAQRQIEEMASESEEPTTDARAKMTRLGQTISALERVTGAEADATSLFTQGVEQLNAGNIEAAVEKMSRAVAKKPDFLEAYVYLGAAYLQEGRTTGSTDAYDHAAQAFETALGYKPGYAVALVNLGVAHLEKGLTTADQELVAQAVLECQQGIGRQPDYARGHYHLARALITAGREEDALASLREAVKLDPAYFDRAKGEPAFEALRETDGFEGLSGELGLTSAP